MKRKRTKPARTTEQQAALDGWIYVFATKSIRGWKQDWVQEARGAPGGDEEKVPGQ